MKDIPLQVCDVLQHMAAGRAREWNVRPDPPPKHPELWKLAVEAGKFSVIWFRVEGSGSYIGTIPQEWRMKWTTKLNGNWEYYVF